MILMVDDIQGVIVAFGVALRRLGIHYLGAATVSEAMELLPHHQWTGFILDLELPDGSGLDLLEWLRAQPAFRTTPAVVITANLLVDDAVAARVNQGRAALHCGAFTRSEIDTICHHLLRHR